MKQISCYNKQDKTHLLYLQRRDLMKTVLGSRESAQVIKSLQDPPIAQVLFSQVRWSWIWLVLRLYVGYEWLQAGWGKLHSAAWTGSQAGAALEGFVNNALTKTGGAHPDVQGWYAWFLRNIVLTRTAFWGYLVSWGETLVGIALILGIFTGIAAFFGSFMNMNYLLAGTVSTNPILFFIALFLVLAWKTAGWWGLDRWVLPALGTPWRPGYIFQTQPHQREAPSNLPVS
jgi:thiosulfate dehydrogenase [quinone] large subunit